MLSAYGMAATGWTDAEESPADSFAEAIAFLTQAAAGPGSNTTNQMAFNQFKSASARSIRTSTIVLATFNTVAAFATAMGILYDAYNRERRNNRSFRFMRHGFSFVPSTDVFPLILSLGITVQSTTFAIAQSTGLDSLFGRGCTTVSQLMLPALFIAPCIQLVLGIETALRALNRKNPFQPRGKWAVTICLTFVGLMILACFLVADFDRSSDFCFTSLFWFVAHYSLGSFVALTGISAVILVCAIIIFVRLHTRSRIDCTERVLASWMVYFLALAVISNALLIPFFYAKAFLDTDFGQGTSNPSALNLSMVASVVANVSGLMTGGLYLFLKSNTISTIGGTRDKTDENERQNFKGSIRRYAGDSEGARSQESIGSYVNDSADLNATGVQGPSSAPANTNGDPNPLRSNAVGPIPAILRPPEPVQTSELHTRKSSYSLFPSKKSSIALLPATTYRPPTYGNRGSLKPPPSMGNFLRRHRRDSSMVSTATVQIGLRLSNVNDIMPPIMIDSRPPLVASSSESVYSLDCPSGNVRGQIPIARPPSSVTAVATDTEELDDIMIARDPVKDARMKTLPPVPLQPNRDTQKLRDADSDDSESEYGEEPLTLSATVYAPPVASPTRVKLPSPRGVGFTALSRSGSPTANRPRSPRSPPVVARRTVEDMATEPAEPKGWI